GEARVEFERVAQESAGLDPAVAERERGLACVVGAGLAGRRTLHGERGLATEPAATQAAAQVARLDVDIEPAVVARRAGAGEAAVDRSVPARREVARIEAGQRRLDLPARRGRPCDLARGVERAGGHARAQRLERDLLQVAAAAEVERGVEPVARDRRLAGG